jgi:hypothetical protein
VNIGRRFRFIGALLVVGACGLALPASAGTNCASPAVEPEIELTPLTVHILQDTLVLAPATDGKRHLAYAAQVTNLQTAPVEVNEVVSVDPAKSFAPTGTNRQLDTDGTEIAGKVKLFSPPRQDDATAERVHYFTQVPAGGSGIMFFDVTYPDGDAAPASLSHRVTVTNVETEVRSSGLTDPIAISCDGPAVLQPPLVGHGWWDGNGCCLTVNAHRSATLPTNGNIKPPEQFAIDYVQIDRKGGCCTGPVHQLTSWPFFGAPVLAAAAGKIVELVKGEPEQKPGKPLVGVTVGNAAGNHVIQDIGNGRFILYAHLRLGSIPADIKVGVVLRPGQRIGGIGNTGSSTAPHLHFQVMDRPSTLNAVGLPFVFETQTLEGQVKNIRVDADHQYESGAHLTVEALEPSIQRSKMPAEGQIFGYNLN